MQRWALGAALLLSLTCLLPVAWSLSLSGGGSLPTVSCPDTGGNHLNFAGGVWTCGTSSSGGVPGNAKADGITKGIATFSTEFTDNGSGLINLGPVLVNKTFSNPIIAAIANLTNNGFVKTTGGTGILTVDNQTYLTGNQTITLSGDATGSGATSIPVTVTRLHGTPFAGASGNLVSFGASNIPADSGVLASQVTTAPSLFTSGQVLQAAGNNRTISNSGIPVASLCLVGSVCTGYQAALLFTPENVANKSTDPALGTSPTLYSSQSAVKGYVDTALSTKQDSVAWGAGLDFTGGTASVLSTKAGFLTDGGTTDLICGTSNQGKAQVMDTGELQFCDGSTTSILRAGRVMQSGLRMNINLATCRGDANAGKLTIHPTMDEINCASDIAATGGPTGVDSVFGRTGAIVAQSGDYTATQVTNAADLTLANVFTHASGQSMRRLLLPGDTSGTLTLKAANAAGTSTLTFPAGTTDFSTTGGTAQVVRQATLGGAFTVSQLSLSDLSDTATVCKTTPICSGYQAALGFIPVSNATTVTLTGSGPNQVIVTGAATQALSSNVAWTLTLPQNIDTAATVRHGSLGLNLAAPAAAGQLAVQSSANGLTLLQMTRFTDTAPTGNFQDFRTAAGVSLWRVDSTGTLQVGRIAAMNNLTTNGLVRTSGGNGALSVDTATYLTGNQSITLSGDATGTGTTSIPVTIPRLSATRIDPRVLPLPNAATITLNTDTMDEGVLTALSQDTLFDNPLGTPQAGNLFRISVTSTVPRNITWGTAWSAATGLPLPVTTTGTVAGDPIIDIWGFEWHAALAKWVFMGTTQSSLSARRRTCMIVTGEDDPTTTPLTNAKLGPQLHLCVVPSSATVEEITVYADAGTPSVMVHRRTGPTSTPLLSSNLATAGGGALACARPTAVAGYAGTSCFATLQNTTIGPGDTLGLTSGIAGGVARRVTVAVSYLLNN